MDPSNSVMRKICYQSSMAALKEVVHVFPMVSLNDSWTRLAVGDVIGEINNASIRVYDLQRSELICFILYLGLIWQLILDTHVGLQYTCFLVSIF